MSERNRGNPTLQFADGSVIDTFQYFSCRDSFTDPIGHLEFDTTPPAGQLQRYRQLLTKGELVTLKIGNAVQGSFLIQTVEKQIGATSGFRFRVFCSSPLITPYEGSVDPDIINIHSQTDVPVADVILKALTPYGFKSISVDSRAHVNSLTGVRVTGRGAETDLRKLKQQDAKAQDGESAYAFSARMFTRLGVVMRMHVDGTILIVAPHYEQPPLYNVVQGEGPGDRFIGEITITDTNADQFSEVLVRGNPHVNPDTSQTNRPKFRLSASEAFGDSPAQYKSFAANFKPKVIRDKHARDAQRCKNVATLALGHRASKAYQIKGTVDGFVSQGGAVWSIDCIAHIKIDADEIDDDFWILERTFHLDEHDGAKTHLTLIPKNSLLLGEVSE